MALYERGEVAMYHDLNVSGFKGINRWRNKKNKKEDKYIKIRSLNVQGHQGQYSEDRKT